MSDIVLLTKNPRHFYTNKYEELLKNTSHSWFQLPMEPKKKKPTASFMKTVILDSLLEELKLEAPKAIVCTHAEYFKTLTGLLKAEPYLGYACDMRKGYGNYKVFYCPAPEVMYYDPENTFKKVEQVLSKAIELSKGQYKEPGKDIIRYEYYPDTVEEIKATFHKLHQYPKLTCDIETLSLKFYETNISTITFCWNKHEGVAFRVGLYRDKLETFQVNSLLKEFIESYKGTLIFHNISFDATVIVNTLYVSSKEIGARNVEVVNGISKILRSFDDTKLIAYLALNSCHRQSYGLKDLAQEYAGNYAQEEIEDITKIPLQQLLRYNLIDGLATWYVYEKYYPKMVEDNQEELYQGLFKGSTRDIIHMQLSGMPLDTVEVQKLSKELTELLDSIVSKVKSYPLVQTFNEELRSKWVDKRNSELKTKKVSIEDAPTEIFNINSNNHLKQFFYEYLSLPVLDLTETKEPATGAGALAKLKANTQNTEIQEILDLMLEYKAGIKIQQAFMPAFLNAPVNNQYKHQSFLYGWFHLGGTVSGRLSSSQINQQQLPATGSKYAKPVKRCFKPPKGWLMVGLDFNALEAHIDALVTKDPAKLAVYLNDYDSHMYNCVHYWPQKFHPETFMNKSIPEIREHLSKLKKSNKKERQDSKKITFALQYGGQANTLEKNCGFSHDEAIAILENYKKLYFVSEQNKEKHIKQAEKDGYVLGAFGLKIRTPLLVQSVTGTRATPAECESEKRTATNARFQSYGLLNSRACVAFNKQVIEAGLQDKIIPISQIHDSSYYLVKDDADIILWVNEHLVKEVQWQDDPNIYHDQVKLGGELSIFAPSWANECTVPNGITKTELLALVRRYKQELL